MTRMLCVCGKPAGEWANRKRARTYCSDACQREAMKAYQRAYKQQHHEELRARDRERYYADKDARVKKAEEVNAERRARQRGAFREPISREAVWERDEGICGICGEAADMEDWHLDHIVPLGPGEHSYANVRVTHPECNRAKIGQDKREIAAWREDEA